VVDELNDAAVETIAQFVGRSRTDDIGRGAALLE
jgi:hypothetical protein